MRILPRHTRTALALPLLAAFALSSCDIEDEPYGGYDSLSGIWRNADNPSEYYEFYGDGTGYWSSNGYGMELDYDYSWDGGWLDLYLYPIDAPSYTLQCGLSQSGYNQIRITYPPGDGFGYTDVYYNRSR